MKKEDWINSIMESRKDIKYHDLPQNVFPKILEKIHHLNREIEPYAWLKIAAILLVSVSLTHNFVSTELKPKSKVDSLELPSRSNNMIYE